ncbi:MAG: protein adenylyltransferase SelO, partial [Dolichospermum sp.]
NPYLGDGRGFLYGQVRGIDGKLYDLGTKGSGTTPYSRGGDGRLTLKGGVREVLAAESLYSHGVYTSRCLSLIETGEQLWRGDEPSPTRSSVMVRFSRSHIRFGTFERLLAIGRHDLISPLLDHVIDQYYPQLHGQVDAYIAFYHQLVKRIAHLAAQWMAAGFCHGVLNTDNMSISGESFDYGPYAFIPTYDLQFTAAYFDYYRRYCYSQQPGICKLNLELLQEPLKAIISQNDLDIGLSKFGEYYQTEYRALMLKKLGFADLQLEEADEFLKLTITFLHDSQVGYHQFFADIANTFSSKWRDDPALVMNGSEIIPPLGQSVIFDNWCFLYHKILNHFALDQMDKIGKTLTETNPKTALLRPVIESVWEQITENDNWQPFYDLVEILQKGK